MARKYPPRDELTRPKLILCEGAADEAFLRALLKAHYLDDCCIRHTAEADDSGRGSISKFGTLLRGVCLYRGFPDITDILVVADNDLSPEANFQKVRAQIAASTHSGGKPYSIPDAPLERKAGNPSITILMIPWHDVAGNLETLCTDSAMAVNAPDAACVQRFSECSGASQWAEVTLRGKMALRALLAIRHKPDPFIGLGNIWGEDPSLVPLGHDSFLKIVEVLRTFLA